MGGGQDLEQPSWQGTLDLAPPPPLLLEHFVRALVLFPCGTGLDWDGLRSRALTRLPTGILQAKLQLFAPCEAAGRWPEVVQLVIIVLLAKADGGYRPIGLLPTLPRIWMRARRAVARGWEASQARPYLFVGVAKWATVAAWKQSTRPEFAASLNAGYSQALLDNSQSV